jgi:hypothetical protein
MPAELYDPIFVFDSQERFHPLAVGSVEAAEATIIGNDGADKGRADLAALPAAGGRMNFPPEPEKKEKKLQEGFGGVGYRREVEGGGLTWAQYWLWYLHNPKIFLVTGDHEGDWEFVQVGYGGDTPVCMTVSQHQTGGSRMWWNVERRQGRPVVYVARDSHANFFRPVNQIPEFGDQGDGKGQTLAELKWEDFDDGWATWPGRWGNSTGEGRSPQSPGCQGERWNAPHRYHSKSRTQL